MEKLGLDTETRVALLENMLVQQNESVNQRLSNIERVLSEIHNKLDSNILSQAVLNTELKAHNVAQDIAISSVRVEVDKTNGKIARTGGIIATLAAALISGAFEYFKK